MNSRQFSSGPFSRRTVLKTAAACALQSLSIGCMGPIFRPQSPDAALSTVDAEAAVPASRRRKTHVDDRAAAIILQRYLDAQEPA